MKKTHSSEDKNLLEKGNLKPYKKPELASYGNLSAITEATSAGSAPDGGTMPNMNTDAMSMGGGGANTTGFKGKKL